MSYRPSRYMQMRRRSLSGGFARVVLWTLAVVLALGGLVLVFAGPIAGLVVTSGLSSRGLGPASLKVTRLDPSGISVRNIKLLGGAAQIRELDVSYQWREILQGRVESLRIDGLDTKVTWAADGKISVGSFVLYPRPAQPAATLQPPAPAPTEAKPPPSVRAVVISNSRLVVALPHSEITFPLSLNMAQDANGQALEFSLTGTGSGFDLDAKFSSITPKGKPAQGEASVMAKVSGLDLPGLASKISSDTALSFTFDAKGAEAQNSRAEVAFSLPKTEQKNALGLDLNKPIRVALGGLDSKLLLFAIDRSLPIARAKIDAGLSISSGGAEARFVAKGWADVPLENTAGERADPQDFNIQQLGLTARQVPLAGGNVEASAMFTELKGPLAVAEGRFNAGLKATTMAAVADRVEANLASYFRLDGLSMSFDLKNLWLETENLKLGNALAQGISRAELLAGSKSSQQVNVVFNTQGGSSLVSDLRLSANMPKLITGNGDQGPIIASLALPQVTISGYLAQATEAFTGTMKLSLAEGKFTHPTLGLAEMSAQLDYNGDRLSGPLSARLLEAADPARPKSLDRLGAKLKSNLTFDSDSIDIKGKITAGEDVEVGTYSYTQKGDGAGKIALKIPPRTWAAEPSFLEAFGPLAALTNTTGTFGIEASATTGPKAVTGTATIALADFGFNAGALEVQKLNAAIALDQIWPPRAAEPQRVSFGQMLVGVPFTDGNFSVALPGDGTAVITQADLKLAGGSVKGQNMVIPLDNREQAFGLDVADVDLGTLASTFATDGISATGKLTGQLPMRMNNSRLFIEKGRLAGRNGNIRYAPVKAPAALAQGGTILLQALADFKYDSITANLNGDITKDLAISLGLKGRNPGLYGGYPIEFNLNLDGPLNRLVRDGLSGYRIPDDIKSRLEEMGVGGASKTENQ